MSQLEEDEVVIECKGRFHGICSVLILASGDCNYRGRGRERGREGVMTTRRGGGGREGEREL